MTGLHVVRQGVGDGGPPVVIVHGALDRSSSFGRVARQLTTVDPMEVVRYDRRGYARSRDLGVGTLGDHVDDLGSVMGPEPVVVFGHSVGGVIALLAAQRWPDRVAALFVYEAPMPWRSWWPRSDAAPPEDPGDEAEAFLRRMIGDSLWERLPARTRAERRAEGPALRADVASVEAGPVVVPAELATPMLVGHGSETTWWHRQAAEELAAEAPRAELVVLADAGHGAHLSHPTRVAELVRRARRLGQR